MCNRFTKSYLGNTLCLLSLLLPADSPHTAVIMLHFLFDASATSFLLRPWHVPVAEARVTGAANKNFLWEIKSTSREPSPAPLLGRGGADGCFGGTDQSPSATALFLCTSHSLLIVLDSFSAATAPSINARLCLLKTCFILIILFI